MLKIINPASGAVVRELEEDNAESIARKYKSARAAQPAWARRPLEEKIGMIRKFRERVVARKEELARTLTQEVGKGIGQSRNELNGLLPRIDFFLEKAAETLREEKIVDDSTPGSTSERIVHEPLGVIGNISAWNYPYFVGSNVFVPALLAGNTVLYKPSEFASLTGLAITEMLYEAGVPKDVFIPVIGGGLQGADLLKQSLNGVFFTGSHATGQKVAEAAAKRLMKVQLELGGKDPVYICEDADPQAAAEATADGAFYNTGQSCCSVERIYVHEKIYDAFVDHFLKTVKDFVIGDPMDDKTYIGPLTRAPQISVLEGQIADAVSKGAKVLCGGQKMNRPGNYFEPTVLVNVTASMAVMRDESFGPIIGIQKVRGDDEALGLMNDSDYGLSAGVYTRDRERAERLLAQVNSGSVYWNCCDRVSPRLPWSGRGNSGIGLTLSTHGILAFTQPKGWHLRSVKA